MAQDDEVHGKHFNIIINARKKDVAAEILSYDDVVNLPTTTSLLEGRMSLLPLPMRRGPH